jgi:hypothetical protein
MKGEAMADTDKKKKTMGVITPAFRVSYPHVFVAKLNTLSGKEEFSLTALFPHGADLKVLKEAATAAIIEKWGPDQKKWPKKKADGTGGLRTPFRDQADMEKELDDGTKVMPAGCVKGAFYIRLKARKQPGIINQRREVILAEDEFYPGCWARASINAFAYEQAGNCGVSFWVNNLQKMKDDAPFSGRPKAEDEFSAVTDETAPDGDTASADSVF